MHIQYKLQKNFSFCADRYGGKMCCSVAPQFDVVTGLSWRHRLEQGEEDKTAAFFYSKQVRFSCILKWCFIFSWARKRYFTIKLTLASSVACLSRNSAAACHVLSEIKIHFFSKLQDVVQLALNKGLWNMLSFVLFWREIVQVRCDFIVLRKMNLLYKVSEMKPLFENVLLAWSLHAQLIICLVCDFSQNWAGKWKGKVGRKKLMPFPCKGKQCDHGL